MLEVLKVDGLNSENLNINKKNSKKTQNFLYDTGRKTNDFLKKIKYRNNGKYDEVPHFIVTKLGVIYQLFDTKYYSKTLDIKKIDKRFIKIALENLGWLNKNTITGFLSNWIGDPYRSQPFTQNWRNYYFWDEYSDVQMESLYSLCEKLSVEYNIPNEIISSQEEEKIINFSGIVCKSNYSNIYTDINPSFNFRIFEKNEHK